VLLIGTFMAAGAVLPGPGIGVRLFVLACGASAAIGALGQLALWSRLRRGLPRPSVVDLGDERALLVPRLMLLPRFGLALWLVLNGCLLAGTVAAALGGHLVGAGVLATLLALGVALAVPGVRVLRDPGGVWLSPTRILSRAAGRSVEVPWTEVTAVEPDGRTGGIRVHRRSGGTALLNVHVLAVPPEAVMRTISTASTYPTGLDAHQLDTLLHRESAGSLEGYVPVAQGDRSTVGRVAIALAPVLLAAALLLAKLAGG
jgi:hypothetical protein